MRSARMLRRAPWVSGWELGSVVDGTTPASHASEETLFTAPSGKAMSDLVKGLAVRGKLLVIGLAPDPLEVDTGSLVFGMHSISGSTTGSVQDEQETVAFSLLEKVEPMIEVMPLSKAREAYDRMMAAKARFRMVLVTENGNQRAGQAN